MWLAKFGLKSRHHLGAQQAQLDHFGSLAAERHFKKGNLACFWAKVTACYTDFRKVVYMVNRDASYIFAR